MRKLFVIFLKNQKKTEGTFSVPFPSFFLKFQVLSIDIFYLSTDIIFSTIELPTSYTILESLSCTYLLSPFSFPI